MYQIEYYKNHADKFPIVMHDMVSSSAQTNRILSGKLDKGLNKISTAEIKIGINNSLYLQMKPLVGMIRITNARDGSEEFFGRLLDPEEIMSRTGVFSQSYLFEDELAYLNDVILPYQKFTNAGVNDLFTKIMQAYNARAESHKRFKVGMITVTTDYPAGNFYVGYQSTWDTLKERVIAKFGGYIRLRRTSDGNYIDYLQSVGEVVNSPIELGENIKSARRLTNFQDVATRIVPVGKELETTTTTDDTDAIREKVTISSVNGGKDYIEDVTLQREFGIIEKKIEFPDETTASGLLARANEFKATQQSILTTWEVPTLDKSWIDSRFKKYEVGNIHPIINPPMSGTEYQQIVDLEIDLIQPQQVNLTIGADRQTFSRYLSRLSTTQQVTNYYITGQETENGI